MNGIWQAKLFLKFYQLCGLLFYIFGDFILKQRAKKGKEDLTRKDERYGFASQPRKVGPLVWLHGASIGEVLVLLPLLQRIQKSNINVLITTGTVSAAKIVSQNIDIKKAVHQYLPFDIKKPIDRFLDYWQPDLIIFAESELWPNLMLEIGRRKLTHIIVNGRMSARSYKLWQLNRAVAKHIFSQVAQVIAQSKTDAERFKNLGSQWVIVAGNLKSDAQEPKCNIQKLAEIKRNIGLRPAWIAVSTHMREELAVAHVHKIIKQYIPNILTIIVPRHVERCRQIHSQLRAQKLNVITRSSTVAIADDTDIFLGDTMGEIGLYLRLAKIAFMGRSLKAQGGQNPLEPAMLSLAILSGKHVQNFHDVYKNMIKHGGARLVADEKNLAAHIIHLMQHEKDLYNMRNAAKDSVRKMKGAFDITVKTIDQYITPLRVKSSLYKVQNNNNESG